MTFAESVKAWATKRIVLTDEQARLAEAIADRLQPDTVLPIKDTIKEFLERRDDR